MKRYAMLLIVLIVLFGFVGMAAAGPEGDPNIPELPPAGNVLVSSKVQVTAQIGGWASLSRVVAPSKIGFVGKPNEEQSRYDGWIEVQCNVPVIMTAEITAPLTNPQGNQIKTMVSLDYGPFDVLVSGQTWGGYEQHNLGLYGVLGDPAQEAGEYTGEVTVTLSRPL
ncbi:MAG: hypothetical protein AB1847_04975 [bacterium]